MRSQQPGTRTGLDLPRRTHCHAVVAELEIPRAHVVGHSYSAAVALTLAGSEPSVVATLSLLERPPLMTDSALSSATPTSALEMRRRYGTDAALDAFLSLLTGGVGCRAPSTHVLTAER